MKTTETQIKVLSKNLRKGTTNDGRAWERTEYVVCETTEREDGSIVETTLETTASGILGELEVGATYNAVIYISSREYDKDGKKMYFPSFRITRADKVAGGVKTEGEQKLAEAVSDDIPFNEVP
jgi:hypothetical protein